MARLSQNTRIWIDPLRHTAGPRKILRSGCSVSHSCRAEWRCGGKGVAGKARGKGKSAAEWRSSGCGRTDEATRGVRKQGAAAQRIGLFAKRPGEKPENRCGGAVLRQEKSARATQRVQRRHHLGKGRKGRDFRRALPVVAHKADAAGGRGQVGPPGPRRDQTERIALVQAAHGSARRIVKPEILYDPPDRVERPGALADHIVQALTAGADVLSACPGALVFSV